jgi:ferri-bacillibactin esterase
MTTRGHKHIRLKGVNVTMSSQHPEEEMTSLPLPIQSPVVVSGSMQFDWLSRISGRTYRLFVFKPAAPPPPAGYPVVVVTDGNLTFPLFATMSAGFAFAGQAALVVGVGYPIADPMQLVRLRTRDLTPPTPLEGIPHRPGQPPIKLEDYGGSELFYRFLVEELRPAIASAYAVSASNQTLYGHSWGGLFTLTVLFNHPASFRSFVASSPSIWWNQRSILSNEPSFARAIEVGAAAPRVLMLVGKAEQEVPERLPPGMTRAQVETLLSESRMVDNAREMAGRLQQLNGGPGYEVRFHAFEGEDHLTATSASVGRALAFALEG